MLRRVLILSLSLCLTAAFAASAAETEARFRAWTEDVLWPEAQAAGIARSTFEAAIVGKALMPDLPGLVAPKSDGRRQAVRQTEFGPPGRYFREKNLAGLAASGRSLAARHGPTLARIEERTGVPGRILLAIWGRESAFGRVAIPHDAFRVLATRAFLGSRAPDWFRGELVLAMKIAQEGHAPTTAVRSSAAGALGQPQFMPSSYLAYAADGDGDGRADIWRSEADTLASIASYLAEHGWERGRDWGFEVRLPEGVSCTLEGPDRGRKIAEWADLGVTRISGRPFPEAERGKEGFLLLPAGTKGPAFIVTPNFYAIKAYNHSDLYALFVGNAADRIEWNVGAFRARWDNIGTLYRSDIAGVQRALEAEGHDVGGADGLPGYKTRRSIGAWQESQGISATCFPDRATVAALAR